MKKIIFVLFLIFLNINIVNAETGTISLIQVDSKTYTTTAGGVGYISLNFSDINFYQTGYNSLTFLSVYNSALSANTEGESTTCNIISGGTGSCIFSYSKNEKIVRYWFDNTTITGNIIKLSFTDMNVRNNVSIGGGGGTCGYITPSTNTPIGLRDTAGNNCGSPNTIYNTDISNYASIDYNITYPSLNVFTTVITKNLNSIPTLIKIENNTNIQYQESTFTTTGFTQTLPHTNGIYINMTTLVGGKVLTLINGSGIITTVSGNITTDKSSYNISENILYNYSLSNAVCGSQYTLCRVKIYRYIDLYTKNDLFITYAANGVYNKSFYIPDGVVPQLYYIELQYFDSSLGWVIVDSHYFNILSSSSIIQFERKYYNLGETIRIITLSNTSGYIRLIDSGGILKLNETITSNNITHSLYNLIQTDVSGTWNVYLYNSTGIEVDNDFTIINFDVIIEPTPTVTIPQTQIDSQTGLIDISDALSIAVFGQIDSNSDYEYSDSEISHVGNKIFSTLLLIAFILLLSGAYYAIKGKNR